METAPENFVENVEGAATVEAAEAAVTTGEQVTEEAPKKRRGRKPGSGKKAAEQAKEAAPKKKPGRPSKKDKEEEKEKEEGNTGTSMVLQLWGHDIEIAKIEENIKAQFVAEGHRAGNIKNLQVYIKPEENKAYYVINDGKFTGDIGLF